MKSVLDENRFYTIWDFLDYWIFNNAWISILFTIFLGVAFEIILIRTCELFKKKLELWKNGSSCSERNEDVFPRGKIFAIECWSISQTSSIERIETFSGRVTTSPPPEENGDNITEETFLSNEYEYQGSHFCETHSSSGGTNTSLSMFHSKEKNIFMRSFHREDPQSKYQTQPFSSNNLFSIMKTNRTKNTFLDAVSFPSTFTFTRAKDLNMTPCPPVHLFLSLDQIKHVEENVRKRISVNPKSMSGREANCLHPGSHKPLIHSQHPNEVVLPAEALDTFLDQSVMQNQLIHKEQFTSQTQECIHNQESVISQPGFIQPLDVMRLPFSNSTQDSFQAHQIDHKGRSQHFNHIPCIVEAEDSTKGIECDEHFSETQCPVYFNDQNRSKHLVPGQNSVFQNADFLSLRSNSLAEDFLQQKVIPDQQPVASLESNQHYAHRSMSLSLNIKRQRNRRKMPDNERKLSLKVPRPKAKKTSHSQVFPIIVCHTSENKIKLRCKKKNTVHQRKTMSDIALHLISVSKLITPHVKKYFLKCLVAVIPDLTCEHILQGQNESLDIEKINYTGADKHTVREEVAGPMHPPLRSEKLPAAEYLIETTEGRVPFCENPTQTLDSHITEDKEYLNKNLCADATRPFKVRKKSSRPKNVLGVKHKFKVKSPAFSLRLSVAAHDTLKRRRKVGDSFEINIKQMLHDVTAPELLNVQPQRSSIRNNKTDIETTPTKPQVEKKEEHPDPLEKERKAVDPLEAQLCRDVKAAEPALPGTVAHAKRSFRSDACPVKGVKTEKEMFQAISLTEAIRESVDSLRMDSFCLANTKTSTATQTEFQYCAELELNPLTSAKLLTQDSLSQSSESNVSNNGDDTREISYGFNQNTFSCSVNYCMPVLIHSKKKDRTRFTNMSTVRLKCINKVKPMASKTFNITGNKKKSKLDLKIKLKRVNKAKAFLPECQNTICLSIHRSLQEIFCHAQLKQEGLANKICVDCVAESSVFYNRERIFKEKENPFVQAASQHGQHGWADADQRKETLTDEPDPSPISLSQEQPTNSQDIKYQKDSLKSTLETSLQMPPIQAEGLQTTTKTESGINFPVVPKILSPEAGTSSPGEFTNMASDDLESDENSEHELGLYPEAKDSETSIGLQVTFLQSSDSVTRSFVSRPKGKRKALKLKKKQTTMRHRHSTMREIKPSVSQSVNGRYSKKINHKEMKDPQKRVNIAGACLDFIHSEACILLNKKNRSSKPCIDKQRIRRPGCMEPIQEKLPDGRNTHSLGFADFSSSSTMKNYEEEREEEPEHFLISENSPRLICDTYQEKDHDQAGRTITQVQAQTPAEVISCSTPCPISDELKLERLEGCFSVSPLMVGEDKDSALSEGEYDLFDERQHKEQAADSEREAEELSVSYTNPSHSGEIKCDSTKMKGMYPEEKIADEIPYLTNVALDINMSVKIEMEKAMSSKKSPCSVPKKSEILLHEGKVTSDDIKEIDLQSKEVRENDADTLCKSFPQDSQHFAFCSHQSRDPNSHELKQRGRAIMFTVEQEIPQPSQSAGLTQRECTMCTSNSKVPPIQSQESQIDEVNTDRTKYDIAADGTHSQKLNSWDRLEREGFKNDLQVTITESLNISIPDVLRSKRKSRVSTCKALQGRMCSTGITMKGRKPSVSKVLTISQCGHRKTLLPKTLKPQISELLKHSAVLSDSPNIKVLKYPTAEKKNRLLTQELAATMIQSLSFSTPTSKERENLKLMDKGNEISNNSLSVKTRKAAISQTLITAGCGTPKQGEHMEGSSLNAIFSPMPVSLDLNTCGGRQDRGMMWTVRFSPELHDQSEHKERDWCTNYTDKDTASNGTKDVIGQGGEEGPLTFQHFSMAGPNSVQSGLQLVNSATYPELERTLYDGQADPVNVNNLQSSMVGVTSNTPSIQSLAYSEVDTQINGEEAMQIAQSSHHPKLQRPSDIAEIIYTHSNLEPILNNEKCSIDYTFQKEESTTPEENMHLKEKTSVLQKIQLDITEPRQELQKIKDELNVVETSTSMWISCPGLKSDTRLEKADDVTEVTLHTLTELSLQTPSAPRSEASKECANGDSTSATLKQEERVLQKTEHEVKIFGDKVTMHTEDKDCTENKTLSQDLFSSSKEQGKIEPQNEEQARVDRKDKKEQNYNHDGKDQEKMDPNYTKQGECSQDDREEKEKNPEGKEPEEAVGDGQEQEEDCPENGEQETWNHKCDTPGKVNPNSKQPKKADQQGESKEKEAPECLPSKSSHKLMPIRTEEEMQGTIKSANSQLQHQKLLETGKTEQTASTEDDDKSNVKIGKQCESQTWMDRGKIVHTKDAMHPKDTSSNKNQLPLANAPRITGHYGADTTDEQTNVNENLGHVQERNCELGEGLTFASLPHSKVDIEMQFKKETWIETGSFSSYSQSMESSDAETPSCTASLNNIISDSKRSRYMPHKEDNGVNTSDRSIVHPKAGCVNINKSPLSYIPEIKRPKLHLEEKRKKKQENRKEKCMLLREAHSVITSSDASTLDKAEEVETEVMQRHVPHSRPQESPPVGQVAPTKSISNHAKRRKLHLAWEEEEVQTSATDALTSSSDLGLKAKISATYVLSVKENRIPRKRKTPWRSSKEKAGKKQEKTGECKVFATKIDSSMPSVSHHGLSPLHEDFLVASCTGELTHSGSNGSITLPNVISKAKIQDLYDEAKVRVSDKDSKDRITLRARISPPTHFNDSMSPSNIREQKKEPKRGKSEPTMIVLNEIASLPFPSFLKLDTRVSEEENILAETDISFLPPTIEYMSESDKRAYIESSGHVLSNRKEPTHEEEKNRLIKDVKDKEITNSVDQRVKKFSWSHTLSTKELQKKTQVEKLVDLANTIVAVSISQLQLNTFLDAQIDGREVYSEIKLLKDHVPQKEKKDKKKHVDVNNIYWKTKQSPVLPMQNLSNIHWKTREPGGKAKQDISDPGLTLTKKLTKTATSPQPILIVNAGIMDKCTPMLRRSSVSLGYFQKSSDSEGGIYIQPITGDTSVNLQNKNQHMSEENEEPGMQVAKIITHKYQETKVQELQDEQSFVLTKSSSLLPDLLYPKLSKKTEFNDTKLTLRNSALQRLSTKRETLPRDAIVDDTTKDVQKQHIPQREEIYRKQIIDRQCTDVTLKSQNSLLSQKLHRTELPMHINSPKPKEQDNKSEPGVLRKMCYNSKPPTNITLCKAVQVDEERAESALFYTFPQMFPALSDAEKMADTEAICRYVRKGKPCTKKIEKTVDLTIGQEQRTKVSPISQLLNAKEFVLNMKVLEKKVHKDKSELAVIATRTFLSMSSPASRYSQDKTQKDTAGITGHAYPQGNFQEAADAQETANRESAEDDSNCIAKTTEHNVLQKQARSQESKSVISAYQISEIPQVDSECESEPPDLNIDLTRLGMIKREKMLDIFFTGQKDQLEECEKNPSTKIGNWKKENEIKDNLSHKTSPKFPVSLPKKSLKETLTTSGTLVCLKGPVTETEQETGSARSIKPKKDKQSNATVSEMLPPEKTSQNKEEQNNNMKKQAIPHSKSEQQIKAKSFSLLIVPVHNKNQRIHLQTDVDEKIAVSISPQIQSWAHVSTTEFNVTRWNKDSPSIIPEQEQCDLELPHKSHDSLLNSEPRNLCLQTILGIVAGCEDLNITHKPDMNTTEQEEIKKDTLTPPECTFEDQTSQMVNISLQNCDSHAQKAISEDYSCRVYLKVIKMNFRSPKIDNRRANLKTNYQRHFPPLSCVQIPTLNVSNNSKVMTKDTEKQEGITSLETWSNQIQSGTHVSTTEFNARKKEDPPSIAPLSHILYKFSMKKKDDLLVHFCTKAVEIKATGLPRIVAQSYAMTNAQDKPKPLFKCIHSATKEPKRTNRVLVLFDERSFCEIDHDLQCKYLRSIPRPSVTVVSKPNVLPKHTSKLSMGRPSVTVVSKSHVLPKHTSKLSMGRPSVTVVSKPNALPKHTSKLSMGRPSVTVVSKSHVLPKHTSKLSMGRPSVTVVSKPNALPKHTSKLSMGRPSVTVVSKPNVLPKHTSKLSMGSGSECKKVEDSEGSSILSFNKELLQHVPFQKKNPQQSSLLIRKLQEPTNVPSLQGTEQNDMRILSDLKLQMTTEKDKQCHVWFEENNSYKHSVSGTQQNNSDLADSFSSWISDDWTNDIPLNTETSTDLAECPASEESDSEECVFIETNFYLTQDSQKFLIEVPKGIPLADTHKMDEATFLKPFYCGDLNDYHPRTHRKHTSPVAQSCYQSQNTRKYRINSKMQSPEWLSHSSSNTVEIESTESCITWNEDWTSTTWSRTSYSLTSSTTESNIKLNLEKKHGKSYMYPQIKERMAKSDLWRKSNFEQSSNYSHSHSEEKHPRRKRLYHYESKEPNPQTNQMPEPNAHWQNIKFYSERRENQPFLYACVPADSMDVIPQTIRWVIPPKISQQRNFKVPRVANISKSWNLMSSSKKLLGSLSWAFNRIRYR